MASHGAFRVFWGPVFSFLPNSFSLLQLQPMKTMGIRKPIWAVSFCWLVVLQAAVVGGELGTPRCESLLRLPEAVTVATLSNGLTVIVQENHVAPVATVRCFVKNTGSAYEGKNLGAGLSHVLEHVVAAGTTTHRTEKEIEKIVDGFGGATNAFTSTDMTSYFIDCPAKNTMEAIELVADSMQHVKFEPSEFARELKVVRRELADGEVNRQRVLWKLLHQTVYTTHPARHPIIGYLDVLNATTNQTIIDFYHSRYVPNNQVFVVVGDVRCAEGSRRSGQAIHRHASGVRDVRAVRRRTAAAFAARGGLRNGGPHVRHGVRLADGEAFPIPTCMPSTWRRTSSAKAKARAWYSG